MSRTIATLALVALVLVPDWASAFVWRPRVYRARVAPPVYVPPPVVVVPVPACVPVVPAAQPGAYAPGSPLPPPTVQVSPGTPTPPADPGADAAVRPAGNLATPTAAPADPPKPMVETPPAPKPAEELPANKLPKQDLPVATPKVEAKAEPKAPPPATVDPPKIELPPLQSPPGKADAGVPPLVLPPIAPTGGLSESKYRPATADRPAFAVLPVDGTPPAGANPKWTVGFYNYTGRELELRVEGAAVRLPARSYVTASVPGTFTWRVGGGADETTTIPASSGGVEVVLK